MLYAGSWRDILDPYNLWHFGEPDLANIFGKEFVKVGSYCPNQVLENFHTVGETKADKHILMYYWHILTHPQRRTAELGFQGGLAVGWVMPLPSGCCTSSVQWPKTCAVTCLFPYCCCWLRLFGLIWYPPLLSFSQTFPFLKLAASLKHWDTGFQNSVAKQQELTGRGKDVASLESRMEQTVNEIPVVGETKARDGVSGTTQIPLVGQLITSCSTSVSV